MKQEKVGNWLFPELFKVAVSRDPELGLGARVLSVLGGVGLIILEPIVKVHNKLNGK